MAYSGQMQYVETVTTLRALFHTRIDAMTYGSGLAAFTTVYDFIGTDLNALLAQIPHLVTPSVTIWYSGSTWDQAPRRVSRFHLIPVVRDFNDLDAAEDKASKYVEDLIDEFQWTVLAGGIGTNKCEARSDTALPIAQGIAAFDLLLEVEDH